MNPLAIKYGLMALAILGVVSGSIWVGHHFTALSYKADIALEHESLERARSEHDAQVAKIENAQIVEALAMQEKFNADLEKLNANSDSSQRRITDLVRQARAASGNCAVPRETSNPGSPQTNPTGGDGGLSERIGADFNRAGFGANKLALIVRLCVPFALSVGR